MKGKYVVSIKKTNVVILILHSGVGIKALVLAEWSTFPELNFQALRTRTN